MIRPAIFSTAVAIIARSSGLPLPDAVTASTFSFSAVISPLMVVLVISASQFETKERADPLTPHFRSLRHHVGIHRAQGVPHPVYVRFHCVVGMGERVMPLPGFVVVVYAVSHASPRHLMIARRD